jgi:hypothetical protein
MSPILGSIGGMSHEAYRGNLDDYADDFFFNNISNAEPGVLYTSGITTITGINNKIRVSVGTGGSFSVNGDAFSTSPRFIRNNDQLRLELTTAKVGLATDFSREHNINVIVGKRTTIWTVTTRPKNDNLVPVNFTSVTNLPVGVSTISNTVTISGLEPGYSVPVSVTGFGASVSINGGPLISSGNVFNGDNFYINHPAADPTNQFSYGATRSIAVSVGTYSTTWNVLTQNADLSPDPFSFVDIIDAEINTSYTSNLVTITGINSITVPKFSIPIFISGDGFEYSKNGGTFTNQPGTVIFGDTIRLRRTTTGNYATTFTGAVFVGDFSTLWSITTKSQPFDTIPNPFSFNSISGVSLNSTFTSNEITLSGMTAGFFGTASISGSGEFRVVRNGIVIRDYSSSSTNVQLGDGITLRNTSSSNYSTTRTSTFSVSGVDLNGISGTTSASWSITTQGAPAPPPPPPPPPPPVSQSISISPTNSFYSTNQWSPGSVFTSGSLPLFTLTCTGGSGTISIGVISSSGGSLSLNRSSATLSAGQSVSVSGVYTSIPLPNNPTASYILTIRCTSASGQSVDHTFQFAFTLRA